MLKVGAFGKKQIIELNSYIQKYYGDEVNIHMFQGIFVGYMSSANDSVKPMDLISGANAVLEIVYTRYIDKEFILELYRGLYHCTDVNNAKYNNIVPMITLDKLRGKYFTYNKLNVSEKKNLLDWYVGYFMSLGCFLRNNVIDEFLSIQQVDGEDIKFGENTLSELFYDGMITQEVTFYELIKELNPNYQNPDINILINRMVKQVETYSQEELVHYRKLAQSHGCSLLSSALLVAEAAVEHKREHKQIQAGNIKVH